jgi:hypothetical protein
MISEVNLSVLLLIKYIFSLHFWEHIIYSYLSHSLLLPIMGYLIWFGQQWTTIWCCSHKNLSSNHHSHHTLCKYTFNVCTMKKLLTVHTLEHIHIIKWHVTVLFTGELCSCSFVFDFLLGIIFTVYIMWHLVPRNILEDSDSVVFC